MADGSPTHVDIRQVPAIGLSITCNVSDDRQAVFQCFVGADESNATANELLDRMFAMADRQSAKYAIPKLREESRKLRDEIARSFMDTELAEADYERRQAALDVELGEYMKEASEAHTTAYNQHVATQRRGEFKPVGQTKQRIETCERSAQMVMEKKQALEADKVQALENLRIYRENREARVAIIGESIAEKEAILAGG